MNMVIRQADSRGRMIDSGAARVESTEVRDATAHANPRIRQCAALLDAHPEIDVVVTGYGPEYDLCSRDMYGALFIQKRVRIED